MQWKETRKRDTNWRCGLPSQAVCLIELRDEAAEPLLVRTQDLCRRVQRLLGPPDPASKRLNLREVARGIRYRLTGSRFEQIFTYYRRARQHFPKRYQNMLRLRLPAILKVSLRYAYPRCESMRRGGKLFRMEFAQASESVRIVGVQNQNDPVFLFGFGFPAACKVNVAERDVRVTVESG